MAVKIGHASIDENGKISGGTAGDQTRREVCTRTWYSKPWGFVLRCKDLNKAEKMAIACEQGCANDKIGYDQIQRNTLYTQAKNVNYDLSKIITACECDCSSFMTVCALAADIKIVYGTNAPTTSTMKTVFSATGEFDILTDSKYLSSDSYLKRGDILVKSGSHTAMVLENGTNATAIQSFPSTTVKCVDVSSYQGNINWSLVKSSGINQAILKIIRKDLTPDNKFEQNWKGCQDAGIDIMGVYNYSYSTTVNKANEDAQKVLSVLNGRKCTIWLDLEDKCQQGLGSILKDIINAYRDVIVSAGYEFGIYTGPSFYNPYIKPYISQIKCDRWWLARYYNGSNKMPVSISPNEQYNPKSMTGIGSIYAWQYTSSGQVPGINGNVDLSVIYEDLKSSVTSKPISEISETLTTLLGKINTSSSNLNIRFAPNSSSAIVGSYKKNELVQLISRTSNNWYRTEKGYISGEYVIIAKGKVNNCSKLNMRKEPEVKVNNVVGVLKVNEEVYLMKCTDNGWYKVKTKDNLVGYVSGKYITIL